MTAGRRPVARESTVSVVAGNVYDKYRTRNPLAQALQRRFLEVLKELWIAQPQGFGVGTVLEVGCGPGDLADHLPLGGARYLGIDVSLRETLRASWDYPNRSFLPASAYRLPFPDGSFDTVVCCEVLEHLEEPRRGLEEIARVCRQQVLISVPWEPVWRVLNVLRGAYWKDLGNTPGHLQHFSRRQIVDLVSDHFDIVAVRTPLPWTMVLARCRANGRGGNRGLGNGGEGRKGRRRKGRDGRGGGRRGGTEGKRQERCGILTRCR